MDPDWMNNWQGYESHIVVSSSDVIDRVKHKIASELWMLHSRWLRPNTFHLVQRGESPSVLLSGHHVCHGASGENCSQPLAGWMVSLPLVDVCECKKTTETDSE